MKRINSYADYPAVSKAFNKGAMALLICGLTCSFAATKIEARDFEGRDAYAIGLWGDLAYSDIQATVGVTNLIKDMNSQKLAFTVHDGDLKSGGSIANSSTPTTCADALY